MDALEAGLLVLVGAGAAAVGVVEWQKYRAPQTATGGGAYIPPGSGSGSPPPSSGNGTGSGSLGSGSLGSGSPPAGSSGPSAGYEAFQGDYGTIYVREAPAVLPMDYSQRCGTAFMGLGPAIAGSNGAFGPGVTENYGVAIYTNGQFVRYNSQRGTTIYGVITGGMPC